MERSLADTSVDAEHAPARAREARKAGVTAFVGTTIEWFDFYIYGSASALVLGKIFFPEASPALGTLAAFATFWVGFLARPLGGVVFGHFGDRFGRKKALIVTLVMMGGATFCVGLLPTYAQIGVAAPVLLIALRMVQGVAMGGEWGGAVLIATEYAPPGKKILYGAFAQQGSPVGNLLATLAFLGIAYLSDSAFESWGWRLPFLASAVLVLVGLFIRLRLSETPEMRAVIESKQRSKLPIKDVLGRYPMLVALGVGAGPAGVGAAVCGGDRRGLRAAGALPRAPGSVSSRRRQVQLLAGAREFVGDVANTPSANSRATASPFGPPVPRMSDTSIGRAAPNPSGCIMRIGAPSHSTVSPARAFS